VRHGRSYCNRCARKARRPDGTNGATSAIVNEPFPKFARWTARTVGHTSAFVVALGIVLGWAATGPSFHFSGTWQLDITSSRR
jgi:hypothetical protein